MNALEERQRIVAINEDAARFYRTQLLAPQNTGPRNYLTDRGFARLMGETLWTVGYAPDSWTSLHDHLAESGYSDELMLEAGLTSISRRGNPIDRFRNRLTFGIRDADNHLVGFTCRAAPTALAVTPKYLNTPRTAAYDKGTALFGHGEAAYCASAQASVITEGPLDAVSVALAGNSRWASFALCGTSLCAGHVELIAQLELPVILALDDDPAGRRALESAIQKLAPRLGEPRAAQVELEQDPASVFGRHGAEALRAAIENAPPATDVMLTRLLRKWGVPGQNVESTVLCLREAALSLARLGVPDPARHAAQLGKSLALEPATVTGELIASTLGSPRNRHPRRADAARWHRSRCGVAAS